jgi:Family of unknown function (DUF5682)
MTVTVLGVRHHGPGSARSVRAALERLEPDLVLIEGPADADGLVPLVADEGMRPPVALMAYAADDPGTVAFWPFAVFSPEWQALTWATARGVPVRFCDLPAATVLALRDGGGRGSTGRDPIGLLAAAAGYEDPEQWWEDVIEHRLDHDGAAGPFPALTEAMAEVRERVGPEPDAAARAHEEAREAQMRAVLRAALKQAGSVAVVCGAWHAPALAGPLPTATADRQALRGPGGGPLPKRRTVVTWVPWTHSRLAAASGYGAGVTSPGWYHHLFTAPDRPVVRWLARVAALLREHDLPASSAHVIEAVRLAETLATLRGRPLAGLPEVVEATRAVLCEGDDAPLRLVTDELVVGEALGTVPEGAPTVPLMADLRATARRLRMTPGAAEKALDLDLRRDVDAQRSRLLHRLRLLGIDWGVPAESGVRNAGTFRESWRLRWDPALEVATVEQARLGATVATAATARVVDESATATLSRLGELVDACLLADLPETFARVLAALDRRAAASGDVEQLMAALPPLVGTLRYGDVRGTDAGSLAGVADALLARICAALPNAVGSLDEDAAARIRAGIESVHSAVALRSEPASTQLWLGTVAGLVDRRDVAAPVVGRAVRLLRDAGRIGAGEAADRLSRALSRGTPVAAKAGWVDGFLSGGGTILIHDAELLALLDGWVSALPDADFQDALPLVRRTFGTFPAPERRQLGERVRHGGRAAGGPTSAEIDDERGRPALLAVARLLGVGG